MLSSAELRKGCSPFAVVAAFVPGLAASSLSSVAAAAGAASPPSSPSSGSSSSAIAAAPATASWVQLFTFTPAEAAQVTHHVSQRRPPQAVKCCSLLQVAKAPTHREGP